MRYIFAIIILITFSSCSKQILSSDTFRFDFEASSPYWIQINDNESGALIESFVYTGPRDVIIPKSYESRLYNIIFINGTEGTYLPGTVQVISMRDIAPDTIRTVQVDGSASSGYIKIQYNPVEDIEDFFDESLTFYEKYGFLETSIQASADAFDINFIKLKGEDGLRYHYMTGPDLLADQSVDLFDLPQVNEFKKIKVPSGVSDMRVTLHGKKLGSNDYRQRVYDTYQTDFEKNGFVDYPIVDEGFEYVHQIYIREPNRRFAIFDKNLPTDIVLREPQFEVEQNDLADFKVTQNDSDMAAYLFEINGSEFFVLDNTKNGSSFVKPEFAAAVVSEFPELANPGKLISSNLIYIRDAKGSSYQTMALPYRRADGIYEFGAINLYSGQKATPFFDSVRLFE